MIDIENFKKRIFHINSTSFNDLALEAFYYQYEYNLTYQDFCKNMGKKPDEIKYWSDIPCLPIEFFKNHRIVSNTWVQEKLFLSSGTTQTGRSKHFVKDVGFYHHVSQSIFENHFGSLKDITIYAILPSYQEMGDSSLLSMVDNLIKISDHPSGYFLENNLLPRSSKNKQLIFGVTYALLDGDIKHDNIGECIIMDTGGMKGRKKEMTRIEVIDLLKKKYDQSEIWSEYGMTELTSQAYGIDGLLRFPNWTKVIIRDINDPLSYVPLGNTGGINIIDLANIESCCFIETKDLGKSHENEHFEVLGRFDNSDVRGCSLMI